MWMIAARDDRPMPLSKHLAELRKVFIITGLAWLACTVTAFALNNIVLGVLLRPLHEVLAHGNSLVPSAIFTSPTEGLTVPLKVAAIAGIVLSLPVILWQVWSFVRPGLTKRERKIVAPIVASGLLLFAAGGALAYFVMPVGLRFLATFLGGNAVYFPDINQYLSFIALLILAFGLAFELPIAVLILGMLRIVSSAWLRRKRKVVWVVIVFAALAVTPGADPFTPLALLFPLIGLFEASVLLLDRAFKR
jgi:sec-independent protein translocase protein TatC